MTFLLFFRKHYNAYNEEERTVMKNDPQFLQDHPFAALFGCVVIGGITPAILLRTAQKVEAQNRKRRIEKILNNHNLTSV